ncbi:uncharacterized protein BX664DRAFT_299382 [Halteromyces radiatus]|uniref:uncharacterized protein n=1 Tax=Halteromyces radiatus TaxID=101107 RepID=UPI00221FB172|nr:uncharacterized protein BX664DRAFT_299382 [Halteromyces radiatus]KAI8086597.1 hypothetical protein BX664DRAFT_299382 [Halteromyces radiatus]
MLLFHTNPRKRSTLIAITILSILVICIQLIPYEYDSLSLSNNILNWTVTTTTTNDDIVKEEKFLTYLPYSRFSNQRGTLLNAALLAKYLDRTLVVPPMFLGYANGWSPGPLLYPILEHMTDPRLQDKCFDEQGQLLPDEPNPPEEPYLLGCSNFTAYAMVPWSSVTDLNLLTRPEEKGGLGIKIIERSDMSLTTLKQQLNLKDENDMLLMKDSTRYQWHFYQDDGEPLVPNPRYLNEVSLDQLNEYQHRLIHFYGIFGFDRIRLTTPESEEYRLRIQQALLFSHPSIMDASSIILEQLLDGLVKDKTDIIPLDSSQAQDQASSNKILPRFVAAHVRAGDADFLKGLKDRVPEFVYQIWDIMTGNETMVNDLIGNTNNKLMNNTKQQHDRPLPKAPTSIRKQLAHLNLQDRLKRCTALEQMILYVATDAPSPRTNADLAPIFDAFPCTFVMDDFDRTWYEPLTTIKSSLDPHKPLADHLVMFVDATVCAWAERFVGTRTSTFSNYIIQYRHSIVDRIIEKEGLDS